MRKIPAERPVFWYSEYMKISHKSDVTYVEKPEGTNVAYYLFPEYEVHYNEQAPHTTQTWHHHEKIWETLYIIDGELVAYWRDQEGEQSSILRPGDVVETERTAHTFANESGKVVRFLVIKRMPGGGDFSDAFKNDKVLD